MDRQSAESVPSKPKRPQPKGGSRKGRPNKASAQLKDMILTALSDAGGADYLQRQAIANPGPFMALVGKVLPLTVAGDPENPVVIKWPVSPPSVERDA